MASRRTISYIGLWALIMPWLGFSWGTKTVLFSLTGLVLLFIGNRHYHSDKNKQKKAAQDPAPIVPKDEVSVSPVSKYQPVPEYMTANSSVVNLGYNPGYNKEEDVVTEPLNAYANSAKEDVDVYPVYNEIPNVTSETETTTITLKEKPKSRIRKKIEMAARPRRTSPKPITLDSLNTDYGEDQI